MLPQAAPAAERGVRRQRGSSSCEMAPMLPLPSVLAARYWPATEREVHSRSFGLVMAPRNPAATTWEQRRGTLEDQAIFGPVEDFECACGKYRGPKYRDMICDRCGVKVTI